MKSLLFAVSVAVAGLVVSSADGGVRLVESLDWAMTDSDLVVRGAFAEVKRVQDKDKVIWTTVTVKVAETYKGEKKDEVKFITAGKDRRPSDRLTDLGENKSEVLVCLVKSDRYKDKGADYKEQPWALRFFEGDLDHSVIDLSGQTGVFVVPMDGRLLTRKEEIVKAAAAVTAAAKPPPRVNLRVPDSAEVARKLGGGGPVWVFVPADARLEEQAKRWLKLQEIDHRAEGAKTLRHFKTEDNTTLLMSLLEDPQSRTDGKVKTYAVRKAAYDVLKEWRVDVKPPVFEEPEK